MRYSLFPVWRYPVSPACFLANRAQRRNFARMYPAAVTYRAASLNAATENLFRKVPLVIHALMQNAHDVDAVVGEEIEQHV